MQLFMKQAFLIRSVFAPRVKALQLDQAPPTPAPAKPDEITDEGGA